MKAKKLLIVGCGDIGCALANELSRDSVEITGMRRTPAPMPAAIQPFFADVTQADTLQSMAADFDSVVVTLTPGSFSDEQYRSVYVDGLAHLLAVLQRQEQPPHVFWVSSTSVYGQNKGELVDEYSEAMPSGFSGQRLLESEQLLVRSGLPFTVIRFAGIYGPGRLRLIEQVLAGDGCAEHPPQYTNRIHRDDCAGFIAYLLRRQWQAQPVENIYIATDCEPATMFDVKHWLAQQLGCTLAADGPTNRRGSKRCSNKRMLASGYQLLYPTFREGYRQVLELESTKKKLADLLQHNDSKSGN